MKIIWSPLAVERINEIADYIAGDSSEAATKWIDEIFKKVERIEEYPLSGRVLPEINRTDIREILFGNYRIIYRILKNEVNVLTIRHCKQRLPQKDIQRQEFLI
jgi:toxin ParE1/3/4